jgi:hypothetical protein
MMPAGKAFEVIAGASSKDLPTSLLTEPDDANQFA